MDDKGKIEKNIFQELFEIFFDSDDIHELKKDIWSHIIRPGLKTFAYNICLGAVNEAFKGRKGNVLGNNPEKYSTTSRLPANQSIVDFRTSSDFEIAKVSDWKNVTVESPERAEEVINSLLATLNRYNIVRVADLFSEAQITCEDPVANNWGWNDLTTITYMPTMNGRYKILLPKPTYLNK